MQWDWGRVVELAGLVVTIVSLHASNVRWATRTRDDVLMRMKGMETKLDILYRWFERNIVAGDYRRRNDHSDS